MKPNVIPSDRSDGFVIIIGERSNFELTLARDCLSPHSSHRNEATRLNIYTVVFAVTFVRVVSLYFLLTRFNPRLKRGQSIGVNGVSRAKQVETNEFKVCIFVFGYIGETKWPRFESRSVFVFVSRRYPIRSRSLCSQRERVRVDGLDYEKFNAETKLKYSEE